MSSNAYNRLQVGNSMGNQGQGTSYGGNYGMHGAHAGHNTHQNHGPAHNQNDSNATNTIAPEDYLGK